MSSRQYRRRGTAAAALAAALSLALPGCTSGHATSGHAPLGRAGFGWFRPGAAPAAWLRASLPGQHATLSYPSSLRPMPGDYGTVTVGRDSRSGAVLVYLNVTPRQGDETLRDWPGFRLAHLRDDGTTLVHLDDVSRPCTSAAARAGASSTATQPRSTATTTR